jgi:Protein of unknown function (DUF998)
MIVALHVVDPGLDPLRLMISESVFGPAGWMFRTAVLVLAAGSVAVMVASVHSGLARARSGSVTLLSVWTASLVLIVVCRTGEHGLPLTGGAVLHGVASVAAFCALPIAALRIARGRRGHPRWGSHARRVVVLAWASLPWLVPLVVPLILALVPDGSGVDTAYWASMPFGLVQRGLAVTELATLAALGTWASSAHPGPTPAR